MKIKEIKSLIKQAKSSILKIEEYVNTENPNNIDMWAMNTMLSGYKHVIKKLKREIKK